MARRGTAAAAVMEVRDVTVRDDDTVVLRQVSLTVPTGITVLLAAPGSGASSLCHVLTTALRPTAGLVLRDGRRLRTEEERRRHRTATGWLRPTVRTSKAMTVRQFVGYGAWLNGLCDPEFAAYVDRALERTGLTESAEQPLGELTKPQLSIAGLAQAVVHEPSLLVLDDPADRLTRDQRERMQRLITALAPGRAVLLATSSIEDVRALGARVVVLDRGRIRFAGTRAELAALAPGVRGDPLKAAWANLSTDVNAR